MATASIPLRPASWPLPLFLKASIAWHGAAVAAAVLVPSSWPWALAAVVANHLAITGSGLWPRSGLLGENITSLPAEAQARREVALTIDDGPDPEVTPRVLDLLRDAGVRATFFCVADRAERHPALVARMVAEGHSVQNHTRAHPHGFSLLGPWRMAAEVAAAQHTLTRVCGQAPACFRAPAGLRNPFLAPVLHRLGLRYVSWTRRGYDTREPDAQRVAQRLLRGLGPGDILLLHDANAARTAQGEPVILEVLPVLIERWRAAGLVPVTLPEGLRLPPPAEARAR